MASVHPIEFTPQNKHAMYYHHCDSGLVSLFYSIRRQLLKKSDKTLGTLMPVDLYILPNNWTRNGPWVLSCTTLCIICLFNTGCTWGIEMDGALTWNPLFIISHLMSPGSSALGLNQSQRGCLSGHWPWRAALKYPHRLLATAGLGHWPHRTMIRYPWRSSPGNERYKHRLRDKKKEVKSTTCNWEFFKICTFLIT